MANRLDEMIEQARKDGLDDLADVLEEKGKQLGDAPSEEDIHSAIQSALKEHLSGLIPDMAEDADPEYMERSIATVKEVFDEKDWHYHFRNVRPDVAIFELGFNVDKVALRVRVTIENMPKVCRVDAILPISAEELYAYPLCKAIVKANYPKRYGAFHYDEEDGELSYRYSYPIGHGIHKDEFSSIVRAVIHSAVDDECYPEIKKCATGKFKNKEKNEILARVNDLVDDIMD